LGGVRIGQAPNSPEFALLRGDLAVVLNWQAALKK
jgi:hypothetical protein